MMSVRYLYTAIVMLVFSFTVAADPSKPVLYSPPALYQCEVVQLHWDGGVAPYTLSALPGDQPYATPIAELGQFNTMAAAWNVSIPAGTRVSLKIQDGANQVNYASTLTIMDGCHIGSDASVSSTSGKKDSTNNAATEAGNGMIRSKTGSSAANATSGPSVASAGVVAANPTSYSATTTITLKPGQTAPVGATVQQVQASSSGSNTYGITKMNSIILSMTMSLMLLLLLF